MDEAKLVVDAKAILGEGPSWHEKRRVLLWVDIIGQKVHMYNPLSGRDKVIPFDMPVSAIVPARTGGAIVATKSGFYKLDLDSGQYQNIGDPEEHLPNNRFNDGKCDPAGRFWAGTMLGREAPVGSLYCLETDLSIRRVLGGIWISNGLGWSLDGRTMYYIDTPTRQVAAFDYDLSTGSISGRRIVITFDDRHGNPDGMTVDAEGMLWIAEWNGYQVCRWSPVTGKLLECIRLPVAKVSSCVFGGEKLDELYITTASIGASVEERAAQPSAGGLFMVKPGVTGTPTAVFAGR